MGFYQNHCTYLPSMLGWFVFSALLSSYNKLVFGSGHLAFPCPLLLTSIHFLVQWLFSWGLSTCAPHTFGGDDVQKMDWKTFLSVSIPCGLVTSGDVGLSNLSLVRISITFYTMIKASAPVFVLGWAYLFGIEKITWGLLWVVALICCGEFLTVAGEVSFDLLGFILCLAAAIVSGARWTLVQLKLNTLVPPLKTTVATMRVLSPSMFISMLILSILIEQPWVALKQGGYFDSGGKALYTLGLGLGGAVLAICMVMFEFHLIMRSNAIVLMIGGVIKEMITILMGVLAFGDNINLINVGGMMIVFMGVVSYKVTHYLAKLEQESDLVPEHDLELQQEDEELKPSNGGSKTKRHGKDRTIYQPVQNSEVGTVAFDDDNKDGTVSLFRVTTSAQGDWNGEMLTNDGGAAEMEMKSCHEDKPTSDGTINGDNSSLLHKDKEEHSRNNGII